MEIINKKFVKNFLLIIFVVAIFVISANSTRDASKKEIKEIFLAGQSVRVHVARDVATKQQGLSGRPSLHEEEGMLFVFDQPGIYGFWMKDMNFPIDIIWISEDLKVVHIKKDARPELFPEQYAPSQNAKYVLEVVSGFSEKNNLKVGDSVEFIY